MNSFDFVLAMGQAHQDIVHEAIDFMQTDETGVSKKTEMVMSNSRRPIKKSLLIAAIVILSLALVACAVHITSGWLTATEGEYDSLPSAQRCIKDSGYEPLLVSEFENGYVFKRGYLHQIHSFDNAENENSLPKSFDFIYELDGYTVRFTQIKDTAPVVQQGERVTLADGIELFYSSYTNIVVPEGYKLSSEQQKAVESGTLYVSYISDGESEEESHIVTNVSWSSNELYCLLQQIDGPLKVDELLSMASTILK